MQLTPERVRGTVGPFRAGRPARVHLSLVALALVASGIGARPAAADGEVGVRGSYYKERSTRVAQPMIDARLEVGDDGELRAHALVDSISSASVASGAAGETFDENRYEMGASYLEWFGIARVGGGLRFSTEPDYLSVFGHLRGEVELAERNTTLAVNLAGGRDGISNDGAQNEMIVDPIEGKLYSALGSLSVSQVLTEVLVGQLTYDLIYLDGFQENPYRSVSAGGTLVEERVPETRTRHAAQVALRGFIPPARATLIGSYRFYADDWGVVGHTPEVRLIHEIAPSLDVHLRYRYHRQSKADFYRSSYDSSDPAVEPYITDDAKLDRLTTHIIGGKLDVGLSVLGVTEGSLAGARAQAGFEYITQSTYYGNAIAAQLGLVVPFEY